MTRMLRKSFFIFHFTLIIVFLSGCGREVFTGKREARGVWMSRFEYAGKNAEAAKANIRATFEKARAAKLNMVMFQVRGNGDAFYRSNLEPWAESLSDSLGKDPGWDPLEFAIAEAHRLGLELHAWVNTFPYWRGGKKPPVTVPPQPFQAHPEWIVCDSSGTPMSVDAPSNEYVWASPGIPAVRQHVIEVVLDIVRRYDVDGVQFDYIRYPEGSQKFGYSHDSVSVTRFTSAEGNPSKLTWDAWQREQVNQFVFDAYNAITGVKPWVKMSASVIGKYSGSGWTSYASVYQDPLRWMSVGKIDFIVPMVYWERSHPTHPFVPLITEWHDRVAYDRQVFSGISAQMINRFGLGELKAQVAETRRHGLAGVVFFSASGLDHSWPTLGVEAFPYWSLTPPMAWKDSIAPAAPQHLSVGQSGNAVTIRWESLRADSESSAIIYRFMRHPFDRTDAFNIAGITARGATSFVDSLSIPPPDSLYYSVAAVGRLGNESAASPPVLIRISPPHVVSR